MVIGAYQEGEWARGVNGDITADATDTDYWRGSSSGAAFLFQRNGVSWVQTAYLKPSNTREEFYFGNSVALSGNLVVIGAYSESGGSRGVNGNQSDQSLEKSGASYIFTLDAPLKPEIVVQQPLGSNVLDNGLGRIFGTAKIKGKGKSRTFTIQNTGTETLAGLTITKDGSHNQDFIISAPVMTSLAPGASTTFKVTFKPKAKGNRTAAVHITSNDANENRFDIKLKGLGAAR